MTMHLERSLSTVNTSGPRKKKLSKSKIQKLQEDLRIYNKQLKSEGRHSERMTFDEYVASIYGHVPKNETVTPSPVASNNGFHRHTHYYPSVSHFGNTNSTAKQEPKKYTGERKLVGIATMHKSNMVPVFEDDKKYAKDLAHMRR